MIREITFDPAQPGASLRAQIHALRTSEDLLVLRGGAKKVDRDRWIQTLEMDAGLIPDRRHFDPTWAATYAKKHVILAGAGQQAVEVREEFDTHQSFKSMDWWEVSYQPDRESAYSFSKTRQPLHTDNAWFSDPAEINFFIMAKQAVAGGEQMIYPLSRVIEDMSREEPGLFADATQTEVTIKKGEGDFFNRTTIIVLGDSPSLFWNYYRTEKPTPAIKAMCDALFSWFEKKESTPSVERIRCETDDCFTFNDLKMLHGRAAFTAEKAYDRVLLHSMWQLPTAT